MIYTHKECIQKFGTKAKFLHALKNKKIIKLKKGLYSKNEYTDDLEIINKQYNNPIFTMRSALYFLDIIDEIPIKYEIITSKDSYKIKDKEIKQYFDNKGIIHLGETTTIHNGVTIRLYNKERMLLETIRYKNKLPYDVYKEIIHYYRDHIEDINILIMDEYLKSFPKKEMISRILDMEIF